MWHYTAQPVPGHPPGWLYAARREEPDTAPLWHPVGYCADHTPHPTEAQARECYRRWQQDHVVVPQPADPGNLPDWRPCRAPTGDYGRCGRLTRHAAVPPDAWPPAPLCGLHLTRGDAYAALTLTGPRATDHWTDP